MKATIFLTVILTVAVTFISCSDNGIGIQSVTDGTEVNASISSAPQVLNKTLIWSHDGIMVKAEGGPGASTEIYSNITLDFLSNVLITFEGWTDSDTSSYVSQVVVYGVGTGRDGVVLAETGGSRINRHHEVYANLEGSSQVKFYIALEDAGLDRTPSNANLKISKIRIFDLN